MTATAAPNGTAAGSYVATRQELLRCGFPSAVGVAFMAALLYALIDAARSAAFLSDFPRVLLLFTIPLLALALLRGPLRQRVEAVALGFDVSYTLFIATGIFAESNTLSGSALFLTLKMVGTALLFRWSPTYQCVSVAITLAVYFGLLPLYVQGPHTEILVHHLIGPVIGGFFSVVGAFGIDRTQRELFARNARLSASEARLRAMLDAERALLRHVQEANRLQKEFVANMSHELRTPLNVIMGYVDIMLGDPLIESNPETQAMMTRVMASARALHRLVESVLEFARIDRGKAIVLPRAFAIDDLLDELRSLCEDVHNRPDVKITIGPGGAVELCTDYNRLYSALSNLLLNAMKFTLQGHIGLSVAADDDMVELCVRDTGVGIPADQLEYIFEPFRQGDGSPTRAYGGMGLGLAIVRRNAELIGGTVRVESTVGRGSTFTVRVPRVLATAEEGGMAAPAGAAGTESVQ